MVCATSPMLKSILSALDCDEDPSLIVPDVTVTQVASLLSLIYSGEANLYQRFVKQQIRLLTAIETNALFFQRNRHIRESHTPSQNGINPGENRGEELGDQVSCFQDRQSLENF